MAGTIIKQNTAEGGTNGATPTQGSGGNTGGTSGDYFDLVSIGSGNTVTFDSSQHAVGSLSYKFVQGGANSPLVGWTWVGAQADFSVRLPFRVSTVAPGVTGALLKLFSDNAYATQVAGLSLTTAGKLRLVNNADTGTPTADTGSALSANTWYVAQIRWKAGPSGTFTVNVYPLGSTTQVTSATLPVTSGATINSVRMGITTGSMVMTAWLDAVAIGYNGLLARTDLAAAPTAAFTTSLTGSTLTVDGSSSTGTGLTYAWTYGDGSTATGVTPTAHTYSAPGSYTIKLTVTDSAGQTATATSSVSLSPPSTSASVAAVLSSASWASNTSASLLTVLSDQDLSTYAVSSTNPLNLPLQVKMASKTAPGAGIGLTANIPIERLSSTTGSFICKLIDSDGTSVRSTVTGIAIAAGTGGAIDAGHVVTVNFPAAEVATVTDWSGVVIEIDATAT